MKRYKQYGWLLPYILVILGLGIASIYDYQIDVFLHDPRDPIALFFERVLLFPIELLVPFCFFAFYRLYEEKRYYVCYMIACAYVIMDMGHYWVPLADGFVVLLLISFGFMLCFHLLLAQVPYPFWKQKERFFWFLLAVFLSSILLTFTMKQIWGRIRFREMGQNEALFTPWYQINGIRPHHSFPSGHTTTISVLLCFFYVYKDKEREREISPIIKLCIILLIVAMMLSRMRLGAHFLSDVLVGFGVTYTMVQLWRRRFFR